MVSGNAHITCAVDVTTDDRAEVSSTMLAGSHLV